MSNTPNLDKAYQPREWTPVGVSSNPLFSARPAYVKNGLNIFSVDSPMAEMLERKLEAGSPLSPDVFLFDVETLATGDDSLSLSMGGHAGFLSLPFEGHPAGTLVMGVYTRVNGVVHTAYFAATSRKESK